MESTALAMLYDLFQDYPEAVYSYDPVTLDVGYANLQAQACCARAEDEVGRLNLRRFFADLPSDDALFNGLHAAWTAREARFYREGQQLFLARLRVKTLVLGAQQCNLLFVHDLTSERIQQDEAARYMYMVQNAEEGLYHTDTDKKIRRPNRKFAELLGHSVADIEGKFIHDFLDPDQSAISNDKARRRERGIREQYELRFRRKDGSPLWALVGASPIFNARGDYDGSLLAITDITEKKRFEERLEALATHDSLTGLPNRRLFEDRVEEAIKRATRSRTEFGVLFMDLNRFKEINDTLGHRVGDDLLIAVGRTLETCVRASDTVARIGGDEFLVLVDAVNHDDALATVVTKIRGAFSVPMALPDRQLAISLSIGQALYPKDGQTYDELLSCADTLMYEEKKGDL